MRGKVKQVAVRDNAVVNVFRSERAKIEPLHPPDPDVKNYLFYRRGTKPSTGHQRSNHGFGSTSVRCDRDRSTQLTRPKSLGSQSGRGMDPG